MAFTNQVTERGPSVQSEPRPRTTIDPAAGVLVTGAAGFVGARVVRALLDAGVARVRCLVRDPGELGSLRAAVDGRLEERCEIVRGNLLSPPDCARAVRGTQFVFHLAAGRGKSFPACFQGSVVSTRNLLDAIDQTPGFGRLVNVSSFAVYSNRGLRRGAVWDETCPVETEMVQRHDPYAYAKLKQDELVLEHHQRTGLRHTIVRPGIVFGPGKKAIPGFVGVDTFGIFLHLGGGYPVPLTYVDNCAEAIVLAGFTPGVEGEVFNVVDDDLPSSRRFLSLYKRQVRRMWSLPVPYRVMHAFCHMWERYAVWSAGQLPPVFNRRMCAFAWQGHHYSNRRLKARLGWSCRVNMTEALNRYFAFQRSE